ncbi:hypothetical protein L7F22_031552 [Adiantum nelumboides]|nr:hypothetical protein [Adiantum nelumboides]
MLKISKGSLQQTIHICESQSKNDYLHAEVKACLTSLEDVVDFVATIMGASKPIKVYDSLLDASNVKFVGKTFTVVNVESLKQDPDEPSVSCHDMDFPCCLIYCHYAKKTKSFVTTLQAEDGSIHKRIVNCHYDTSYWNPHHIAFQDLQHSN